MNKFDVVVIVKSMILKVGSPLIHLSNCVKTKRKLSIIQQKDARFTLTENVSKMGNSFRVKLPISSSRGIPGHG